MHITYGPKIAGYFDLKDLVLKVAMPVSGLGKLYEDLKNGVLAQNGEVYRVKNNAECFLRLEIPAKYVRKVGDRYVRDVPLSDDYDYYE